jgi:hypothetical protein
VIPSLMQYQLSLQIHNNEAYLHRPYQPQLVLKWEHKSIVYFIEIDHTKSCCPIGQYI